jgi:hypothetical protein
MFRRVIATIALAAGTVAVVPAAPASAAVPVGITITGAYTGVFVSGLQIVASCDAVAVGAVSAIVIDQCVLTSNRINHPSTLPGNATSSNFVERVTTLDFTLCFHAYAIPIDAPTDPVDAGGCALVTGDGITPDLVGVNADGLAGLGSAYSVN